MREIKFRAWLKSMDELHGMDERSKKFIEVIGNIYENPELLEETDGQV